MRTLAIVIGNDNYHESETLNFAVKDANGIAEVFIRLGYDIIHKNDIDNDGAVEILAKLSSEIANYDATIFYFAGHGFQYDGENYLTTIDCQIPPADVYNCRRNSILLSELMDIYKRNSDKINIVIIDACRKSFNRGVDNTFAPVQAPKGTIIAFSTSPGNGAKDGGFGDHGVYTGALLNYIGREYLSVEELFKKVRRTVSHLTNGGQTPWEHTSLIGDFYFNTGQLVYSLAIPYSEQVVKDSKYQTNQDQFSRLIGEVKRQNWEIQNDNLETLLDIIPHKLDKDQQFILGRNLLQSACGNAFKATQFFSDLKTNLIPYNSKGENHLLNGILFEMYFNKYGDFRKDNFKQGCFAQIMTVRKDVHFASSFDFITTALVPFRDVRAFWIPLTSDNIIDIDVRAVQCSATNTDGSLLKYEEISSINFGTSDITDNMRVYNHHGINKLCLENNIAHFLAVPQELIQINSNITLNRITIQEKEENTIKSSW